MPGLKVSAQATHVLRVVQKPVEAYADALEDVVSCGSSMAAICELVLQHPSVGDEKLGHHGAGREHRGRDAAIIKVEVLGCSAAGKTPPGSRGGQ